MREYETMFVVQPEISDEGSAAILAKLDGELGKGNTIRLLCEDWGKRKLAYEIAKFHKGHYRILRFLDDGQVIPGLERQLRLDESVLRFLTVLVDDDVVDIEARKARAAEEELEQEKRAAERAERDAEEARQREESDRYRAEQEAAAAAAAAQAAASEAAAAASAGETASEENDDEAGEQVGEAVAAQAAAPSAGEAPKEEADADDAAAADEAPKKDAAADDKASDDGDSAKAESEEDA